MHQNITTGSRRHFLRGLATLPLIGGAVSLIGNPVQVAQAATREQMEAYMALCFFELNTCMTEMRGGCSLSDTAARYKPVMQDRGGIALRAPLILSAAGIPLA